VAALLVATTVLRPATATVNAEEDGGTAARSAYAEAA
jgi:hypothetical protein